MKRTLFSLSFMILSLSYTTAQTIEECQQAAERNYPLIQQYDMIGKTTHLTIANIAKDWLPQVSAQAQATYQNDVTAFPSEMQAFYQQMGISMDGLKKDQYRIAIDVQQKVYDGGMSSSQKEVARQQGAVQTAQTEVTMYQVRRRVNELYFTLLLIDEQIRLNGDLQELLSANERKLMSMFERGTAAESDYHTVKAERLTALQQLTALQSQRRTISLLLSTLCGLSVEKIIKPADVPLPTMQPAEQRPELKAIEAQLRLADAQEKSLDAALMPRFSVFAQGFYGYPGYNLFEDMRNRSWSLNGMIGARLTWNIGALYTRKNDKAKLNVQRSTFNVQRDVFLFNNHLEQLQQNEDIARYRQLMADDNEIITLRQSVRKAAESKLLHGIIDVNDLVKEIHAENSAQMQQSIHEIEMLKEIYDLKFTTNN